MKLICRDCGGTEHRVYITGLLNKWPVIFVYCPRCKHFLAAHDSRTKGQQAKAPLDYKLNLISVKNDTDNMNGIITGNLLPPTTGEANT